MLLTATANPEFTKDINAWKLHVEEYAKRLKEKLNQSTVSLEFVEVDMVYLK